MYFKLAVLAGGERFGLSGWPTVMAAGSATSATAADALGQAGF